MNEPTPDETVPLDPTGEPGPTASGRPTIPLDLADRPTIRHDPDGAATLPFRAGAAPEQTVQGPGADLTVSFVVARGRGATRSYLAPEGVSRVRASFAPGVILQGRYELDRELGRGGMGVVYLGRDVRLDRPVAVKAILSEGAGGVDEIQREAFAEEARLGANLTHPAIATVYDYGFHEGSPFAVFEFIPGLTLRDLIHRRGKLPLDEVRLIVGALALALDFAHERHVVHRDLKPENIRATEQGQFKVLDLGLAKDFHSHDDWTFCGTPAYASPEQAEARPCDGRTDQYALAVIAFEMLAGLKPFESRDWITLLDKHAHEPPPRARTLQPDVPDAVDEALDKALDKDPNRRFATCTEFATAMGCQLLSAPAPAAEILLETTSKTMRGRWKSFVEPLSFSFRQPVAHLTLTPDALWATYRGMVMRWPIASIAEARRRGRWLRLRLNVAKGKSIQTFKLRRRKECQAWLERLRGLIDVAPKPPTPILEDLDRPKVDPIVLLKAKPSTRFQLLGPVDVKAAKRRLARPALAIRGVMMGADAIVDLQEERLPGAYKTEYRASGTAVRAVDREGRLELKARWFDAQAKSLRFGLITFATLGLIGSLTLFIGAIVAAKDPRLVPVTTWLSLAGSTWLFALTVAFGVLRWPQLARPVTICFFAMAASWIIALLGLLGAAIASGRVLNASIFLGIAILNGLFSFSVFSFYFYLGRRALTIDRDYRQIVVDDEAEVDPTRRVVGRSALGLSILYASWLVGFSGWTAYQSAMQGPAQMEAMKEALTKNTASNPDSPLAKAIEESREAARRSQCIHNHKQIAQAFHDYHSALARFPGDVTNKQGEPLLSWRVAILPYLGQGTLYDKFKLDEPWDSPHNKAFLKEMPAAYACPSRADAGPGMTGYRGWSGNGAFFDASKETSLLTITDGTGNTIAVAESRDAVPWTKPDDMPFDPQSVVPLLGAGSAHPGGFVASFGNGSVRFIKTTIPVPVLRALITKAGGEVILPDSY